VLDRTDADFVLEKRSRQPRGKLLPIRIEDGNSVGFHELQTLISSTEATLLTQVSAVVAAARR